MDEKIIIEGKTSKVNIISIVLLVLSIIWLYGVGSSFGYVYDAMWDYPFQILVPTVILFISAIVVFVWMNFCKIVVTNKRVYGKTGFGIRVDLPLDMISAASSGIFNSVGVSTSSGKISFWLLNNNTEIFSEITKLLLDRQKSGTDKSTATLSGADELSKFKKLLDGGVITQEEFDAKKKQILDS